MLDTTNISSLVSPDMYGLERLATSNANPQVAYTECAKPRHEGRIVDIGIPRAINETAEGAMRNVRFHVGKA